MNTLPAPTVATLLAAIADPLNPHRAAESEQLLLMYLEEIEAGLLIPDPEAAALLLEARNNRPRPV